MSIFHHRGEAAPDPALSDGVTPALLEQCHQQLYGSLPTILPVDAFSIVSFSYCETSRGKAH